MNLNTLSDLELHQNTVSLAAQERALTDSVLEHLQEVERRRLYARYGYSSLFLYCVKELKYCNATAQLRIDAMRLAREVPEVKPSLIKGEVSLSTVSTLQKFFRHERSQKKFYSQTQKQELFEQTKGLSRTEVEKQLAEISPQAIPQESMRVLTPTQTEVRFVASEELLYRIERFKELRPDLALDASFAQVFEKAFEVLLKKIDPKLKKTKSEVVEANRKGQLLSQEELESAPRPSTKLKQAEPQHHQYAPAPSLNNAGELRRPKLTPVKRPYIPIHIKRSVFHRAGYQCSYISPMTHQRCTEIRHLQIEHLRPFAKGGSSELGNLTLLCSSHNSLRAIEEYGEQKMAMHIPKRC